MKKSEMNSSTSTYAVKPLLAAVMGALLLGACAVQPVGPRVTAMPGTGKSFEQFRFDDAECRGYANQQVGGTTANDAAVDSGVRSAAVGTAVGALAGAAIGGSQGAGAGAGVGLIMGSVAGAGASEASARGTQSRYDGAYVQCMYAKGERVPVSAQMAPERARAQPVAPQPVYAPPSVYVPPPPPGYPPPPPPGVSR
jgi:outer membrane lipoprotein SlyB